MLFFQKPFKTHYHLGLALSLSLALLPSALAASAFDSSETLTSPVGARSTASVNNFSPLKVARNFSSISPQKTKSSVVFLANPLLKPSLPKRPVNEGLPVGNNSTQNTVQLSPNHFAPSEQPLAVAMIQPVKSPPVALLALQAQATPSLKEVTEPFKATASSSRSSRPLNLAAADVAVKASVSTTATPVLKESGLATSPDLFKTKLSQPVGLEGAVPLTLNEVVNLALDKNLSILIAKVQEKSSLAEKKQAVSQFLPNGSLSYKQSRYQGGVQVFNGEPVEAFISTILPQAEISLPINLGGREIFNYQARKHNYLAKTFASLATSQDELLRVSELYTRLLNKYIELSLIEKNREEAQLQLNISEARYKEGLGVLLEVLEAKNLIQDTQRAKVDATQEIQAINLSLNTLLGLEHTVSIVPQLESVLDLDFYGENQDLEALVQESLSHEPRLAQAEEEFLVAQKEFRKQVANAFPTVTLQSYINLVGKQYNNLMTTRYAGVQLESRLFEGLGVNQYQKIQQARLGMEQAQLKLDLAKRETKQQIASVHNQLLATQQRMNFSKVRLETAEQARQQAQGRYEAGLGNFLEVLGAARSLQGARNQYLNEMLNYKFAQLTLARRTGSLKEKLIGSMATANKPAAPSPNKAETPSPKQQKASLAPVTLEVTKPSFAALEAASME